MLPLYMIPLGCRSPIGSGAAEVIFARRGAFERRERSINALSHGSGPHPLLQPRERANFRSNTGGYARSCADSALI
jgi:hypothetical protein